MSTKRLDVTEKELAWLIESTSQVNVAFGPSGCWLKYDTEKPMPEDVKLLLRKRGVLNENTEGAGI